MALQVHTNDLATIIIGGDILSKHEILHDTTHGFIAGGFLGSWLGGIAFVEGTRLVTRLSPQHNLIRLGVWGLLLVETAYCAIFGAFLMHSTIYVFGDYEQLDTIPSLLGIHALLSRILITASQVFLALRVRDLSGKNNYLFAAILFTCGAHLAISVVVSQKCLTTKYYHHLLEPRYLWQMMYSVAVISDSIITISLVIGLNKKRTRTRDIKTIMNEIALLIFESASPTTLIAIASLILVGRVGLGTLYSAGYISAQAYALSVLLSINSWMSENVKAQQQALMRPAKQVPSSRPNRVASDAGFDRSILETATLDEVVEEDVHQVDEAGYLDPTSESPTDAKILSVCSPKTSTATMGLSSR